MGPDHDLYMGKTEAKIAKIKVEEQDKHKTTVATYIGSAFLQYQERRIVCAPYMFKYVLVINSLNIFLFTDFILSRHMTSLNPCKGHWVCMYIWLYNAWILDLDSADFPHSSYKKFIDILQQ